MMERTKYLQLTAACTLLSIFLGATRVRAELKPGDVLNQSNWQEGKDMMPDAVLRRFALGQHLCKIIELPKEELRWGSRFNEATEKNQGIYEIKSAYPPRSGWLAGLCRLKDGD